MMSFKEKAKIGGICLALVAAYAFAENNDEKAREEDAALADPSIAIVACTDVAPNDPDSGVMECAP